MNTKSCTQKHGSCTRIIFVLQVWQFSSLKIMFSFLITRFREDAGAIMPGIWLSDHSCIYEYPCITTPGSSCPPVFSHILTAAEAVPDHVRSLNLCLEGWRFNISWVKLATIPKRESACLSFWYLRKRFAIYLSQTNWTSLYIYTNIKYPCW